MWVSEIVWVLVGKGLVRSSSETKKNMFDRSVFNVGCGCWITQKMDFFQSSCTLFVDKI